MVSDLGTSMWGFWGCGDAFDFPDSIAITDIPKWYKPVFRSIHRKLKRIPLICRPRCRWRPRESRKRLEGLSPSVVIIDEYVTEEE